MTEQGGPPRAAKPTAFYGVIQSSVAARATTAETWAAIRDYAQQQGVALPPGMFTAVNQMRGLATGNRTVTEQLARAQASDYIESKHVGAQIFARSAAAIEQNPKWRVDFAVTETSSRGTETSHYSIEYDRLTLPDTVGDLRSDVLAYAAGLGDAYDTDIADVTDIFIGGY